MMSSVHTADTEAPTEANPGSRGRAAWPLELPLGAHLSTSRFGYTHHGVYAGHGRVVHYSGLSGVWQSGPVEEVSLFRFAGGREVRIVAHSGAAFSPEEIVRRARSRLGEDDYRVLSNNCEHFCNWCRYGVSNSAQADRLPFRLLAALFHA